MHPGLDIRKRLLNDDTRGSLVWTIFGRLRDLRCNTTCVLSVPFVFRAICALTASPGSGFAKNAGRTHDVPTPCRCDRRGQGMKSDCRLMVPMLSPSVWPTD